MITIPVFGKSGEFTYFNCYRKRSGRNCLLNMYIYIQGVPF